MQASNLFAQYQEKEYSVPFIESAACTALLACRRLLLQQMEYE